MKGLAGTTFVVLLASSGVAHAQLTAGNVYGRVLDPSGAALPGASVDLTGSGGTRTTISGDLGEFRFLGVDYGSYELGASLPTFAAQRRAIVVTTGQNLDLEMRLEVEGKEESVTVLADTPLLDARRTGTGTTPGRSSRDSTPIRSVAPSMETSNSRIENPDPVENDRSSASHRRSSIASSSTSPATRGPSFPEIGPAS